MFCTCMRLKQKHFQIQEQSVFARKIFKKESAKAERSSVILLFVRQAETPRCRALPLLGADDLQQPVVCHLQPIHRAVSGKESCVFSQQLINSWVKEVTKQKIWNQSWLRSCIHCWRSIITTSWKRTVELTIMHMCLRELDQIKQWNHSEFKCLNL